jgi:3D (Asp-Asp-Asp) domain-containing protein
VTTSTSITRRSERARIAPLVVLLLATASGCALVRRGGDDRATARDFYATAYCVTGTTAMGVHTRPGIVAADPAVLPLGSRIRVSGAGTYSGVYTVADTGAAVRGREIDIFMTDLAAARRFGRRRVRVEVLERGRGR